MCGRYVMTEDPGSLAQLLAVPADDQALQTFAANPHYNICPGQNILAFRDLPERRGTLLHWGLVPSWSKDRKNAYRMINARSETVFDKPSFRRPVRSQRCLAPASGFYEWHRLREPSQPYFIHYTGGAPMLFAAIWDRWKAGPDEELESVALLTAPASGAVRDIHDRMPVLLQLPEVDPWLDSSTPEQTLRAILSARPRPAVTLRPVSRAVNTPRNDGPELIEAVAESPLLFES
ncbi:MAG TPA: SOS response-associated peptidase [Verrucomicrobiales bacterium]|nr:SOS response-associated peptidase [Verrucomicrobiales bacterium]